ncbi:hypothetical protein [Companilactobacillus nodensis]|uniref:hypothetical protein n=1 Tax=Companilactobacillus nodensis TaxID=460870 RepID=UPI00147053D9|nr:hypothetical protein [Companilactobacillus nodensis]
MKDFSPMVEGKKENNTLIGGKDPFYSKSNVKELEKRLDDAKKLKGVKHTIK